MSGETLAHCFCQLPAPFTRNSLPAVLFSEQFKDLFPLVLKDQIVLEMARPKDQASL